MVPRTLPSHSPGAPRCCPHCPPEHQQQDAGDVPVTSSFHIGGFHPQGTHFTDEQTEAQGAPEVTEPVGNESRVWSLDTPQPTTVGAHGAPTPGQVLFCPVPVNPPSASKGSVCRSPCLQTRNQNGLPCLHAPRRKKAPFTTRAFGPHIQGSCQKLLDATRMRSPPRG